MVLVFQLLFCLFVVVFCFSLGAKASETQRDNVKDVIKYGKDWSIIKLWINNQGPERLKEYGKYIIIERPLSAPASGKGGGSSPFSVYDSKIDQLCLLRLTEYEVVNSDDYAQCHAINETFSPVCPQNLGPPCPYCYTNWMYD